MITCSNWSACPRTTIRCVGAGHSTDGVLTQPLAEQAQGAFEGGIGSNGSASSADLRLNTPRWLTRRSTRRTWASMRSSFSPR